MAELMDMADAAADTATTSPPQGDVASDAPEADTATPPTDLSTATSDVTPSEDASDTGATLDAPADAMSTDVLSDTSTDAAPTDLSTDTADTATPGACEDVSGEDFGVCGQVLGWGFDGSRCVSVSGCGCADACDSLWSSAAACEAACVGCDETKMQGAGLMTGGLEPGGYCDELVACVDVADHGSLTSLVPSATCTSDPGFGCDGGQAHCRLPVDHPTACAVSRLEAVAAVVCTIYGP